MLDALAASGGPSGCPSCTPNSWVRPWTVETASHGTVRAETSWLTGAVSGTTRAPARYACPVRDRRARSARAPCDGERATVGAERRGVTRSSVVGHEGRPHLLAIRDPPHADGAVGRRSGEETAVARSR